MRPHCDHNPPKTKPAGPPKGKPAGHSRRDGGIRTHDPLTPSQVRYQAAPRPVHTIASVWRPPSLAHRRGRDPHPPTPSVFAGQPGFTLESGPLFPGPPRVPQPELISV